MKKWERTLLKGLLVVVAVPAIAENVFNEMDGLVIMEAEGTASDLGQWKFMTDQKGWNELETYSDGSGGSYTGEGYLEFLGNKPTSGNPHSPLEYTFKINKPGRYEFHLRCAKQTVESFKENGKLRNDICNDIYIRLEGDYDAVEIKDAAPMDILQTDTKWFGGKTLEWDWGHTTRLNPKHGTYLKAMYEFKAGETYTLVISGRSKFLKMDRFLFRHTSLPRDAVERLDIPAPKK